MTSPTHGEMPAAAQIAFDQQSDDPAPGNWNDACIHIAELFKASALVPPEQTNAHPSPAADLRHECAKSGFHDYDGCSCTDEELLRRAPQAAKLKAALETIAADDMAPAVVRDLAHAALGSKT